ncbi:MBL fold metallo-hydrolase [Rossellomorea aquimaris]|uniref:MBL fold metallo-hydrolase n=1 Tax=Rossellomorea aquimaris TaxID=189382 RepID=UPI0007D090E6|nr:MBL fold metallo-hydrolase [Rossellomorea aquimaris]
MNAELDYKSFTLKEVRKGVYAALIKKGQGAWGNAGIIDLGDELLVFDTFASPQAAQELRIAAETLTGKQVRYAINSHVHFDHTFGNQIFRDAHIISSTTTRNELSKINLMELINQFGPYIAQLEEQAEKMSDPIKKQEFFEEDISEKIRLKDNLHHIDLTLPSITFNRKLSLHGTKRTAELISFGPGHSPDDTILYLPEDYVLFAGDLISVNFHPLLAPNGDYHNWQKALMTIADLDIETIVPGHGNVSDREAIHSMISYISEIVDLVITSGEGGSSLEELLKKPILEAFNDWHGSYVYEWNLKTLFNLNKKN